MRDRVLETPEKYQDFNPFKFIIYSGKIGEQVPQSNWSSFASRRLPDKRTSRNGLFHDRPHVIGGSFEQRLGMPCAIAAMGSQKTHDRHTGL
jgi:hypothetical protein